MMVGAGRTKAGLGLVVTLLSLECIAGARLLKQSFSSVEVSGTPGTTGQVDFNFFGDGGQFSQSFPVQGPAAFQFSSDNGGTFSFKDTNGAQQTFNQVLGNTASALPPLPSIQIPKFDFPPVQTPVLPVFDISDLSPLDPLYRQKVAMRVQEFFRAIYAYNAFIRGGGTGKGFTTGGNVASASSSGGQVGSIPQAVPVTTPQATGATQQIAVRRSQNGESVSASVSGPGPTALRIGSVSSSGR